MNLPALWAYGAGITTGLVFPMAKARWVSKGTYNWRAPFTLGVMCLFIWPLFAIGLLCEWRAAQLEEKNE
jgi:hypothetical protein